MANHRRKISSKKINKSTGSKKTSSYTKCQRKKPLHKEANSFKKWIGDMMSKSISRFVLRGEGESAPQEEVKEIFARIGNSSTSLSQCSESLDNNNSKEESKDKKEETSNSTKKEDSDKTKESIYSRYIKSAFKHVASLIVQSAILFGKEKGVVKLMEGSKDIYQISSPNPGRSITSKLRLKIPERGFCYDDAKEAMWQKEDSEEEDKRPVKPVITVELSESSKSTLPNKDKSDGEFGDERKTTNEGYEWDWPGRRNNKTEKKGEPHRESFNLERINEVYRNILKKEKEAMRNAKEKIRKRIKKAGRNERRKASTKKAKQSPHKRHRHVKQSVKKRRKIKRKGQNRVSRSRDEDSNDSSMEEDSCSS